MFTGLVQELATVRAVRRGDKDARIEVACGFSSLILGESIAVDGACLTVVGMPTGGFAAEASAETLEKTTLGRLTAGSFVHLERALAVGDRLGGHLVTGHVDGVGALVAMSPLGDALAVTYEVSQRLAPFLAAKGSVTIAGVSLTVNRVLVTPEGARFDVVLVPHTRAATHLGRAAVGTSVNVEVDVLAKYVASLLGKPGVDGSAEPLQGVSLDLLGRQGYLSGP